MRIAMIANHACVRMDKMALPLIERGHDVHCISNRNPAHWPQYKTRAMWEDLGQCIEAIKIYSHHVDLFHAHNEPSWFVTAIKEHCSIPVILDVHDSFLARSTPDEATKLLDEGKYHVRVVTEERNNFQLADGLVFPGQAFGDAICSEFKLTQPRLTLPSYCTRRMQVYSSQEWLGGLVYEGRIDLGKDTKKHPQGHGFRYCDYEQFAVKCKELGIDFHIYSRNDKPFLDIYEKMSLTHVPVPFVRLIGHLSRHDWGLVGNIESTPEWEVAFPNKMFEYLSAGVPVVAINAHECGKFLTENGLGIEIESLEELTQRWSEHTEIRKSLLKTRQQWVMESHIADLERLYEEVLNG